MTGGTVRERWRCSACKMYCALKANTHRTVHVPNKCPVGMKRKPKWWLSAVGSEHNTPSKVRGMRGAR